MVLIRRVTGDSMLPSLRPGHIIVANSRYKQLRPGDVIVMRHDGLEKIKRIQQIKDDHLYLVGDNQQHSTDSRTFGWLHISVVTAKVIWPIKLHQSR